MQTAIKKRIMNVGHEPRTNETKYIKDILKYYVDKVAYKQVCKENKWHIELQREGHIEYKVLEYLLEHFSLWELYIIFFANQPEYSFVNGNLHNARSIAIKNINTNESLTAKESAHLKRKVWDLHPIIFELILEMVNKSQLFWDSESKELVFPDIDIQDLPFNIYWKKILDI
ncbi:MAG: hypothetical protein ABSA76_02160 [Bacteroidales bacterium]